MTDKLLVYISGPMTGYPFYNFKMFYAADAALMRRDDVENVFNPARHDAVEAGVDELTPEQQGKFLLDHPEVFDLERAQRTDIHVIQNEANALCLLPGWSGSLGARAEAHLALWLGRTIMLYNPELPSSPICVLDPDEAKTFLMSGAEPVSGNTEPAEMPVVDFWAAERQDVLDRFSEELAHATGDGSKKRQAGEKPPWYDDKSHEGAIFSHITKWKRGEQVDPDSGAHPLVHAAWRCLAIACSENGNNPRGPLAGFDMNEVAV